MVSEEDKTKLDHHQHNLSDYYLKAQQYEQRQQWNQASYLYLHLILNHTPHIQDAYEGLQRIVQKKAV